MKITFDSNVWRKVVSPQNFPKDPNHMDYVRIHNAIADRKIVAFLSETVFTLEAVKRSERKDFFKRYFESFSIKNQIIEETDDEIIVRNTLGPNKNLHPRNNDFLNEHFSDAVKLGVHILKFPRIAGLQNEDISVGRYKYSNEKEMESYQNILFKVARDIENLGAGIQQTKNFALKFGNTWQKGIINAPDSENGNIAKYIAEWADADSVASHIAINGDYFCTYDLAKKAGENSVLNEKNIQALHTLYGFKTINPTELVKLLLEEF